MKNLSRYLLSALLFASTSASAGSFILNDYNVVTIGDLNYSSSIYGKTFVGGDLNAQNKPSFASRENNNEVNLQVAGTVNGSISAKGLTEVGAGNTISGSSNQKYVNGSEVQNGNGVSVNSDLANLKTQVEAELNSASTTFANMDENTANTVVKSGNTVTFTVDSALGKDDYAVFNIDGLSEVFNNSQNQQLEMNANNIDDIAGIIINVTGKDLELGGGGNFIGGSNGLTSIFMSDPTKILWNFIDAESIDLASQKFFGSILAPLATLTANQDIDGSVGVYSIAAARQIHDFETTVTPPVVTVSEPNALFLLSIIVLMFASRKILFSTK